MWEISDEKEVTFLLVLFSLLLTMRLMRQLFEIPLYPSHMVSNIPPPNINYKSQIPTP